MAKWHHKMCYLWGPRVSLVSLWNEGCEKLFSTSNHPTQWEPKTIKNTKSHCKTMVSGSSSVSMHISKN
jgi:hypothetical protein